MVGSKLRMLFGMGTVCGVAAMLVLVTGCPFAPGPTPCTADTDCDDGLFCNGAETCVDEACVAGTAPCIEGETCDEENDLCYVVCETDAECDDADLCTTEECVEGVCEYTPMVCDDEDACTTDACVDGECVYTPMVCDDEDLCTTDECVDGECVYTPVVCDDEDLCTTDECVDGACVNTPVECAEGEVCDPLTGGCVVICETDAECDDDDLCTTDTCGDDGVCVNTAVDCNDDVDCTDDSCDVTTGDCLNEDNCTVEGETCNLDTGLCEAEEACTEDADCDDLLFCNGIETCDLTTDVDNPVCVNGDRPCDDTDADGLVITCDEGAVEYCDEGDTEAVCTTCPSESILFTLGQDTLVGTTGDDIFNAPLEFNTASGTQVATMQTGDSANGLAGSADVLHASFNLLSTVVPTSLAGIETINITNFATGALTLSATNISGVDTINQVSSVDNLIVTGLQELTNCGFTSINDTNVDMSLTFAQTTTTAATDDEFTCTLTDATVGTLTVTTNAVNGFETGNFVSNGSTDNRLSTFDHATGTNMTKAVYTGAMDLTVNVTDATILTHDASAMTGGLTLGTGTEDTAYNEFANPSSNFLQITGGSGDDVIIFEDTLATTDFSTGTIDLGDGTDVVQNSFATTFGAASKLRNVEEVRYNATAAVSVNFSSHTGLTTITNEEDGSATAFTLSNVPATVSVFPTLNFRGDNTAAAQTYDTITYTATGATDSSDQLTITVGNRGTALNATGTSNVHTMGAITAPSFELLDITVADGPGTFGGLTMTGLTTINVTGSSNVTTGTIAPASGVTLVTINTSAVVGNFNGTFDYLVSGATYTGGDGNDTVVFSGSNSTATSSVVSLGNGNNNFTGDLTLGCADTITGGTGNDTITCGCGADTVTTAAGSDIVKKGACTVDEAVIITVTDFTVNEDTITLDEGAIEANALDGDGANIVNDWGSILVAAGEAFTVEVITADGATVATAVDMVVISDALVTFADAAAYIAATTATVDLLGAAVTTALDNFLIAYEDGSGNTRIGVFACDAGAAETDSDAFDLGFDIMVLSGVNAADLDSADFNVWE